MSAVKKRPRRKSRGQKGEKSNLVANEAGESLLCWRREGAADGDVPAIRHHEFGAIVGCDVAQIDDEARVTAAEAPGGEPLEDRFDALKRRVAELERQLAEK